jgi:CO/xanthine dehydrogenase Mo-binding subunit
MNKPLSFVVGQSAPQIEAQEKVSGSAQYIADLYRPNMLYGALLQSPHAHARIVGHDISQAAAMPGVHAIITGDDLQEHWRMGAFIKDEHALAKGKVRYVGEPVAAVAAETESLVARRTRRRAESARGHPGQTDNGTKILKFYLSVVCYPVEPQVVPQPCRIADHRRHDG